MAFVRLYNGGVRPSTPTAGAVVMPVASAADEAAGTHFMAMECIDGVDLHKLVKEKGPLPVQTACDYIRQAALGLQHAFEQGMVHRDVKPQNLLLTRAGAVKVLDMGL